MQELYWPILPSLQRLYFEFVFSAIVQIAIAIVLIWLAVYYTIRRYQMYTAKNKDKI